MKRITIGALGLVVAATAGCRDMGLEGNIPAEEARTRETSALMAAISTPTGSEGPRVVVDGRLWVPSGRPLTLRADELRSVGSAEGQTVYARQWDRSPYDALFVRAPGASAASGDGAMAAAGPWTELQPVRGRSGPIPAEAPAGAPEHH